MRVECELTDTTNSIQAGVTDNRSFLVQLDLKLFPIIGFISFL